MSRVAHVFTIVSRPGKSRHFGLFITPNGQPNAVVFMNGSKFIKLIELSSTEINHVNDGRSRHCVRIMTRKQF